MQRFTEGSVIIRYGFIEQFIHDLGGKYHILEVAFDHWGIGPDDEGS